MRIEPNESRYIYVDSSATFGGYPHVFVKEGEVYSFTVNPLCKWKSRFLNFTAEGSRITFTPRKKRRLKTAPYYALCGTIDGREDCQFHIGLDLKEFTIPEAGALQFFANKAKTDKNHGSGYVILKLARIA